MRYGIPAYRLPREVLAGELARIEALGVRMTCGHRVTDLAAELATGRFDAVFVAVGAHLSKHVDIPARDASKIIDAVPFLRDVAVGARPVIGRRVAVYGGGNTAMDAARVARLPGAQDDRLPTQPGADARARGRGLGRRTGGRAHQLAAYHRRLRRARADRRGHGAGRGGRPHPTGKLETRSPPTRSSWQSGRTPIRPSCRSQTSNPPDGTVLVSPSMMTGCPGVFAAWGHGAVRADGHGRCRAREEGRAVHRCLPPGQWSRLATKNDQATFERLHPWYFTDAERRSQPELEPDRRVADFTEVVGGLSEGQAAYGLLAACRAATALSATAATAPARRTRSSRSAPATPRATSTGRTTPTYSTMTGARAAGSAPSSARSTPSR